MCSTTVCYGVPFTDVYKANNVAEEYLKSRQDCKFDRNDFDSLSNKFLSKLVIRAN